jgi:hypothetical protein
VLPTITTVPARLDATPRWLFVAAIATSAFVLFSLELFAGLLHWRP